MYLKHDSKFMLNFIALFGWNDSEISIPEEQLCISKCDTVQISGCTLAFTSFEHSALRPRRRWHRDFIGERNVAQGSPVRRHPPQSWVPPQLSPAASHKAAFYSLWISVKSLSSHTALFSPPLFSTLGGHFSSNSVKERLQLDSPESIRSTLCKI